AFFESLDSQNRYAILYRLHMTEKRELRAKKLEKYVTMLAENRKIYERGER
ncbi:MAG: YdeI/OmpD-associated family protein, partial [Polyangiaceae bacterium]